MRQFASRLDVASMTFIPISALHGDNVVTRSANMPWYEGTPLLHHLDTGHVGGTRDMIDARLPVQTVIRPRDDGAFHDYRGYVGQIAGGVFRPGDKVTILPGGRETTIRRIHCGEREVPEAFPPMSVALTLSDDIDIGRGDMIAKPNNRPQEACEFEAMLCWLSDRRELREGDKLILRHTTREVQALVRTLRYRVDIDTLHKEEGVTGLSLNQIGRVAIKCAKPLCIDPYHTNRATGGFILVDPFDNTTLAAGMIR